MANADMDFSGPLAKVITEGSTLEEFLELARAKGTAVMIPEVGQPLSVWP